MNKIRFLFCLLGIGMLAGCLPSTSVPSSNPWVPSSGWSLFGTTWLNLSYEKAMKKPDFSQMINGQDIQQAEYNKPWTRKYSLTKEDVKQLKECWGPASLVPYPGTSSIEIPAKDLQVGKTFTLTGEYDGINNHPLTWTIIAQIKKYGVGIMPFNLWSFPTPSYTEEFGQYAEEEWVQRIREISSQSSFYREDVDPKLYVKRYPFNTLFVTNDLLLHVFHKIFSNELKYFEESSARVTLSNLSEKAFKHFLALSKSTKQDKNLNEKASFLTAYWAIPYALLPSNDELKSLFEKRQEGLYTSESTVEDPELEGEMTDNELKKYLGVRFESIAKQVPAKYQSALRQTWLEIWKAESYDGLDPLLLAYSPTFIQQKQIKQDFTQFKPRSHYTTSSFLKTYFMASKWLMREKFYFWDQKLAETSLYMIKNMNSDLLKPILALQESIWVLIGDSDDVGIPQLQKFIASRDGKISLSESDLETLSNLKPQKIASARYVTQELWSTDKDSAKKMLEWFVFFGEKFTIDSFIFDQLTAGSATKEMLTLPNMQTSLIVPDVLENYQPAHELVNLWLSERAQSKQVLENEECSIGTCKQVSGYPAEKIKAQEKVKAELADGSLLKTVYHQWLAMLGQLFVPVNNAPYFKQIPLYIYKNLATYLGSYTELKHDTLLYTKQSYAEMWAGGDSDCDLTVYPPTLPVPKGYIEADTAFLDRLIALNESMKNWFADKDNFAGFGQYLQKIRAMSQKQMKNQTISDDDFERLRTSYRQLSDLTFPRKLFWEPLGKEERSALIADIFTSEDGNPLYQATGRPLLMAVMIDDVNGKRVVMWPIFSHYEFYKKDKVLDGDQRYSDLDWQHAYDALSGTQKTKATSLTSKKMREQLKK